MPHELLGSLRVYTTGSQHRAERVPEGVEVQLAFSRLLAIYTGILQVPSEHANNAARMKVVNNCGNAVVCAEVKGSFTGDFTDTGLTACTVDNGVAVVTSSGRARKPSFGFDVTDVVKDGLEY